MENKAEHTKVRSHRNIHTRQAVSMQRLQKRQRCAFPGQLPEPSHLSSLNWIVASRLLGHAPLNCPSKESFTQRESRVRIYASNHGVQNDLCQLMP